MTAAPTPNRHPTAPSRIATTLLILHHALLTPTPTSSLAQNPQPPRPIKRIAVIGTGIAGLSLAHAFENNNNNNDPELQVTLFDSRPTLDIQSGGAGVQLNGGMAVLRKINPQLQASVAKAGLPLKYVRSRAKPWNNDSNDDASFSTLLELDIEEAIRDTGGLTQRELIVGEEVMSYSIMRGALQEVLLRELSSATADRVFLGKTLSGIRPYTDEDDGISCEFVDGSAEGPFDLVVGCDGIKSAVKEYIETGAISDGSRRGDGDSSIYSGIRIQYAVQDGDPSTPPEERPQSAELRQYFGDGAYALRGTYGAGEGVPPAQSAFLIFRDEDYVGPFRKRDLPTSEVSENVDWVQDARAEGDARADCFRRIRNASIPMQDLKSVIENSDRFLELGVYFHNPLSRNGWRRQVANSGGGYCVLGGDAAHAMPPFLGQGANQAVQDAYCLATKIRDYNSKVKEGSATSLEEYLRDYEKQRWRPTADLTLKAAFLGYLEVGSEGLLSKFRDVFFRTMGKVGVARKVFLDGATPKV